MSIKIRLAPDNEVRRIIAGHLGRVEALEGVTVISAGINTASGDDEGAIYIELEGFNRRNLGHAEVGDEMARFERGLVDSIPGDLSPIEWRNS